MRLRRFSPRTQDAYLNWMRRYYEFHARRDPADLGAEHVTAFLSDLATRGHVAASTQNQALAALLFLYREVLTRDLPWLDDMFYREHGVAHFHAEYQGQQVTFTFDGKILGGSLRSRTALRLIEEWATSHREALEANWQRVKAGEPLEKIEPLD